MLKNVNAEAVQIDDFIVTSNAVVEAVDNTEEFYTTVTFTKGMGTKRMPKVTTVTIERTVEIDGTPS